MISSSKNRSHVLITLGILFAVGGASRFVPNVLATAESTQMPEPDGTLAQQNTIGPETTTQQITQNGAESEEVDRSVCFNAEMAKLLSADRKLLDSELAKLNEEKLSLLALEAELNSTRAELESLHALLDERWQQIQATSSADITHLAQMYGSMKPDQAAQIFDQMDPTFAAGFLRTMRSEHAGLILANMSTEKAYVVSVKLATINRPPSAPNDR